MCACSYIEDTNLVSRPVGAAEGSRAVWTPSSVVGQPFPTRQVGIEVWGIGAFKIKGIAGHSKVRLLRHTDTACAASAFGVCQPRDTCAYAVPLIGNALHAQTCSYPVTNEQSFTATILRAVASNVIHGSDLQAAVNGGMQVHQWVSHKHLCSAMGKQLWLAEESALLWGG